MPQAEPGAGKMPLLARGMSWLRSCIITSRIVWLAVQIVQHEGTSKRDSQDLHRDPSEERVLHSNYDITVWINGLLEKLKTA